jgi:hypothetical protein
MKRGDVVIGSQRIGAIASEEMARVDLTLRTWLDLEPGS